MDRFAEIYKALELGDHVTTPDAKFFVKEAKKTVDLFFGIPHYALMVRDLRMMINRVETFLAFRKSA